MFHTIESLQVIVGLLCWFLFIVTVNAVISMKETCRLGDAIKISRSWDSSTEERKWADAVFEEVTTPWEPEEYN